MTAALIAPTPVLLTIDDNTVLGPVCHSPCVQGMGNIQHGIMVIGVAPGKEELKTGKPLTGPTGKLFNNLTNACGFPRSNMYVTNMLCWYQEGKITRAHMNKCFGRVHQEIMAIRPKLIILLGSEVCQYWTDHTINQARGSVLWSPQYSCWIMPMIQPAALFHDTMSTNNTESDRVSNVAYDIVRDLRKIPEILTWPTDGSKWHVPYHTISSTNEAQQILNDLPRNTPVAVDVETNSGFVDIINIRKDALVCLAISDGVRTWVGEAHVFKGCVWPEDVQYTFHYSMFDTAIIHRDLGVWLQIYEDTLLQSYTCDERPGYHSLKPLAREYEGAGFYEDTRTLGLAQLMEYNAKDAAYTARLCTGKLREWQLSEGTRDVYTNLLIPAANVLKEVKARGARVDTRMLAQLEQEWGDEKEQEQERMHQIAYEAGWPLDADPINLNSWQQLGKLLYSIIGLSGGPSTAKSVLETLSGRHPFVDALLEYRHLEHNYSIYVDGWVRHISKHSPGHGRIHPDINLHGTATGRRSYAKPAVQTIPRPSNQADKYGKLRQAIIPTNDDYLIAYADYSRAEIYTAYGYSHDPVMWEALQKDYHLETAVNVMHKSRAMMAADDNYREEMRRIAKVVTFGIFYGMEAYSLSQTAQISVSEAQAYINGFFRSNTLYNAWYRNTLQTLERTGEIQSITGRKRRFVMLEPNPRILKQAVNFPIQSTAGDVTLSAVIKLHPLLKPLDSYILFDVHDAIVFEISKKHAYEAMQLIKHVMEAPPFPLLAPDFPCIPTEQYIGKSWGHAQKLKNTADIRNIA